MSTSKETDMAGKKSAATDVPTFADRWAPDHDGTWSAAYHDRNEVVIALAADEHGRVAIADEAADRAAASMGLAVVGAHQEPAEDAAISEPEA